MSEIARQVRSAKRAWAHPGSSHDRLIRVALIVLPAGIGVLSAFLVLAPLFMDTNMSFVLDKNRVAMANERLRIDAAEYRGQDAKGQAFRLRAGEAVQKSSSEPVVQLRALSAEIQLPEGPASLKADTGNYNLDTERVAVEGPLKFRTSDGYSLDTHDATVDLKTRHVESGGAVSGTTPMGVFSGNKLTADLEKRTVSLSGNARLRIYPKRANRQ
ncbi:MAG: LPS export ABC transporter periplasmic protein LptC [Sphingomonadales bacterium]|nr:MAG: LPS export ABC transporter periplasmic protein LptC [Sphingomonadales bacterium]